MGDQEYFHECKLNGGFKIAHMPKFKLVFCLFVFKAMMR